MGYLGKLPYAGLSFHNIHYIAGLQELGYDVHYVESVNYPEEYYDPSTDEMTSDASYAIDYLADLLPRYGVPPGQFTFVDFEKRCHGSDWRTLREVLNRADFVLSLAIPSWFDELERCPRRAFVDGDPVFTQIEMAEGGPIASVLQHYDILFTYGVRIGMPDCPIPTVNRTWIPTRTVTATRLWDVAPLQADGLPITTVMHWAAGSDVTLNGRVYGHKNREFERFKGLPKLARQPFVLAVGLDEGPRKQLRSLGWQLVPPLSVSGAIEDYRKFIAGSRADFGIAKHAYVASNCGWFSDRSTCYLASGRPVLHQETGFSEWLPTGEGVLKFSDVSEVLECLRCLNMDYDRHAQAARRIAEEYFEAATVLRHMLSEADFS